MDFTALEKLSQSIRRGTQHFDREHVTELFRDCICGDSIDANCPMHARLLDTADAQTKKSK